ncbi:hypothetical protein NQU49_28390, partial [Escherichia coli]|uniref:hypothetical protein n=1 Tax=Escherichia coli TaxID=562 RepID=UPI0021180823
TGGGYTENFLFQTRYYDSNLGSSGFAINVMDIAGFNQDSKSGIGATVLGLTHNKEGFKYDYVASVTGLINLGMFIAP